MKTPQQPLTRLTQPRVMGVPVPPLRPPAVEEHGPPQPHTRPPPPRAPLASRADHERTQLGLGGPTPQRGAEEPDGGDWEDRSTAQALTSADKLTAELAARNATIAAREAELATKNAELTATKREVEFAKQEAELVKRAAAALPSTPPPDRKAFLTLLYSMGGALVLLMGAATAWLGAHTAKVEDKADKTEEKRQADKVVTAPLPEKVQAVERDATECQTWARLYDDYTRQVFRKLGVVIPEQPNALPAEPIKTRAPLRRSNAVTGAPVLEVLTPPPPLP